MWALRKLVKDLDSVSMYYYSLLCGKKRFECPMCDRLVETDNLGDVRFHIFMEHINVYCVPWSESALTKPSRVQSWDIAPALKDTKYTDERIVKRVLEENRNYFRHLQRKETIDWPDSEDSLRTLTLPCVKIEESRLELLVCVFCCFSVRRLDEMEGHVADVHLSLLCYPRTFFYDDLHGEERRRLRKIKEHSLDLSDM